MKFNYYFEHKDGKVIIDQSDWDHILEMLMSKDVEITQKPAEHRVQRIGLRAFISKWFGAIANR